MNKSILSNNNPNFVNQNSQKDSSKKGGDTERDEPNNRGKETYPINYQRQTNLGEGQNSGTATINNIGNNEINLNKDIDMRDDYEKDEDGKKQTSDLDDASRKRDIENNNGNTRNQNGNDEEDEDS